VHWSLRADLPQALIDQLRPLLVQERPTAAEPAPPDHHADYLKLLDPVTRRHEGPALAALKIRKPGPGAVPLDTANADVLEPLMPDWLPDVPHRSPFFAVLVNGAAVAVCASVRITGAAHQAGVEVHPSFRRQGHGRKVVAAWAAAVEALGARALYSTTWDNVASRRLAESLGFTPFASDYVLY
jgi:ribosomal protein S18 acetylase RimI-like enzyme